MDKLQKSLFEFNDSFEKSYPIIPGEIGISLGGSRITEVPGRGQFVYVRLRSNQSEIIQVFNGLVFPGYGVPVLVQWHNSRYEIVGVDVQRYQQWLADNPIIAKHGATHSMDKEGDRLGTDPVWVYPYQFMPSLVSPFPQSGILNAYINPLMVQYGGQWRYIGNTGTSSLTTYNPISGSSIVLVSLDAATGNPYLYATTGTYIPSSTTGTNALLSYLPGLDLTRYIPLSFILLASGTSGITWDNLFDVRQFFTPPSTGSSYLTVNGTYPINQLNFSGGVIVVSTGTSAFLSIASGSSGGGSAGNVPLVFDVAGTLETGTSQSQPYLVTDAFTADYAYLYCETLGITGTTKATIKKNGVSIFTGSQTLDLAFNATGSWVKLVPYYFTYVEGDVLTVDILQKATGAGNAKLALSPSTGTVGGGSAVGLLRQYAIKNGTTDISTGTLSYVDMTDMTATITTVQSTLECLFTAGAANSIANAVNTYQLLIDGVAKVTNVVRIPAVTIGSPVSLIWMEDVSAGPHTINVQWKGSTGTLSNRPSTQNEGRTLIVKEYTR